MREARNVFMAVILISVSFAGWLSGQSTPAADRVLAAEGDFVAQTKAGVRPLSHWKLWRLANDGYEVVDQKVKNVSSIETFQFDAQLRPTGFTKSVGSIGQAGSGPSTRDVIISCQYKTRELTCTCESRGGKKSSASIAAEPPYVFMGEFSDWDFAWYMTGVVNLATRGDNENGLVKAYWLTDGSNPDGIALEEGAPIKIVPAGQEDGQFDGKQQVLKKFEDKASHSTLRTNAKSIVVSISPRESSAMGFAIINYKEYIAWGPSR
jgi:hypothetical protein